jgi:acetamidase/formamidase
MKIRIILNKLIFCGMNVIEKIEKRMTLTAEQLMMGEKVKYKGKISDCISGKKITMKFSFPLSLITEKMEMITELLSCPILSL